MKLNNRLELTYSYGYFIVREYRLKKDSTTEYGSCTDYTFAHVTGALTKLKELSFTFDSVEGLEDKLKLESGIKDAKRSAYAKANPIKKRG